MKNQNAAKVATNMIATGMTTAGIIVPRLDDDLPLVEALVAVEEAWLEIVCVFETDEDAAAADSELYCAGSVTTEVAVNVLVDNEPPASVTMLTEFKDSVVNEVGAAAEVIASVPNEVTEVDICDGSVVGLSAGVSRGEFVDESPNNMPMMSVPFQLSDVMQTLRGESRKATGERSKIQARGRQRGEQASFRFHRTMCRWPSYSSSVTPKRSGGDYTTMIEVTSALRRWQS